jgi:phosphinothricin acetyltransferase
MLSIRPATVNDLDAIAGIYNDAVLHSTATFDTEPRTRRQQEEWFRRHAPRHPVLVAALEGTVIGWAALSAYIERPAAADSTEAAVYVKEGFRGQRVGRKLMEDLLEAGKAGGFHTLISRIVTDNAASLHLHESLGFRHAGVVREVARKFDRWLDLDIMQYIYRE